ncbi:MAG: Na+/H+ antiporter NhaC family protein [Fidelibacterota bacterium]|nr:MAG: Na+/H+ antiporter NhaC family protein [Candidatus Neomarinimicrobiota bacterium]
MKPGRLTVILTFWAGILFAGNTPDQDLTVQAPHIVLKGVPFSVTVMDSVSDSIQVRLNGDPLAHGQVERDDGQVRIRDVEVPVLGACQLEVITPTGIGIARIYSLPGVISILPPLMAIALALLTKQVLLSLFCGIWLGAVFTLGGYNPFIAFLRTVDTYLIRALTDPDHMSIVLFTMTLGGMVGVISRSGGTHGIVQALARHARNRRKGQLATWLMGMLIFFDDYSNTLLVGNTMRPFTDKLKISREKLSYLVDSTAAPIASIIPASTWIGFELGLLISSFQVMGLQGNAYVTFIDSIPYGFYSLMALLMVALLAGMGRDFGPMYRAERRTLTEGKVLRDGATPLLDRELANLMPPEGIKSHWYTAIMPILTMILVLVVGLYLNGKANLAAVSLPGEVDGYSLREIIGAANSFKVLIWAAFGGTMMAAALAVGGKILSVGSTVDAFLVGFKAMIVGIIILTLARSLQHVTSDLHTADYIFHVTEDILNPRLLPAITFVIAALTSFSTGTSWGTMAILVPLVIPLAYILPHDGGIPAATGQAIFLGSIGAILSGAIFGDHCSPISDTTVMSSIASGADHIDHVRTQLPYGLLVGGVTLVLGYIPAGFGMNPYLSNLLSSIVLVLVIWRVGRDPEKELATAG